MLNGTAKPELSNTTERTLLEEGTYPATLVKAVVLMGKPSAFQPEGAPKIMLIWATEEQDADGNPVEVVDYLGFPKNIAYNEKSKFWGRLGEIVGVRTNSQNAGNLGISFGALDSQITSYQALVDHINTPGDNGKTLKAPVEGLSWDGQELIGAQRTLIVKVWDNGQRQGNEIAAVIGAKKAAGKPAAQPAAAAGTEATEAAEDAKMPF